MAVDDRKTLSGLSDSEAQEFHAIFVRSFMIFTAVAVVAQILAWMWRPWLPGPAGYAEIQDGITVALGSVLPFIA